MATLLLFWASLASWMMFASSSDDIFAGHLRSNVCEQLEEINNGTRTLVDGLRGSTLNVATAIYNEKFLKVDADSGEASGLEYDLLQALAKHAGFTVKYNFVPTPKELNMTWSKALKLYARSHDMVAYSWWRITSSREREGLTSPFGFLDLGHAFVQLRPENKPMPMDRRILQFLEPFRPEVWGTLFLILLITAVFYWQVEKANVHDFHDDSGHGVGVQGFCHAIYIIFNQLTDGGGSLNPQTIVGKVLRVSWGWCVLLTIAAYTANLASFLMSKEHPATPFQSIEQAINSQEQICLTCGATCPDPSTGARLFLNDFPNYKKIKMVKDVFEGLSAGQCTVALSHIHAIRQMKGDLEYADRCKVMTVGLPYRPSSGGLTGGWMIYVDYLKTCSVLIRDVLRLHFADLDVDGTLEKFISRALYNSHGPQCDVGEQDDDASVGDDRLDLVAMAGTFGTHVVVLGAVLLLIILKHYFWKNRCVQTCLQRGSPVVQNISKHFLEQQYPQSEDRQEEMFDMLKNIFTKVQQVSVLQQDTALELQTSFTKYMPRDAPERTLTIPL